jgi:hypothetical protein
VGVDPCCAAGPLAPWRRLPPSPGDAQRLTTKPRLMLPMGTRPPYCCALRVMASRRLPNGTVNSRFHSRIARSTPATTPGRHRQLPVPLPDRPDQLPRPLPDGTVNSRDRSRIARSTPATTPGRHRQLPVPHPDRAINSRFPSPRIRVASRATTFSGLRTPERALVMTRSGADGSLSRQRQAARPAPSGSASTTPESSILTFACGGEKCV